MEPNDYSRGASGASNPGGARLILADRERLVWEDVAAEPLKDGEVRIRTIRSAVSVGTEYAWFVGWQRPNDHRPGSKPQFPRRMGYESLGLVVESQSARAGVGDRVVATFGHQTFATVKPESVLILVPFDIPNEVAILCILSCEASRGAEKIDCSSEDPVVITGAGVLGLLALHRLSWLGFKNITVFEPRPERRQLAMQFGATKARVDEIVPLAERFAGGLECSSANSAFRWMQQSMARGGQICVLSDGNYEPLELDPLFHSQELRIVGSNDGTDYETYAPAFFERWRKKQEPLHLLFDRLIPRVDLIQEFESMRANGRPLKVLVSY